MEFIRRVKPYTEQDLFRKDFLTYIKILNECEQQESEALKKVERSNI
jgi:hypothetical protein